MNYFKTKDLAIARGLDIKDFKSPEFDYNDKRVDLQHHIRIIPDKDTPRIIQHFENKSDFYDVGVQGLPSNTEIGSRRITAYDEGFSEYLTRHLAGHLKPKILNEYSFVDWQSQNPEQLNYWVPLGASTVFRYMRYRNGSKHYTHYDAPFVNPENPLIRTLMSGVLYLTNSNSCATCMIDDNQQHIPFVERNHSDWDRETEKFEIRDKFPSLRGSILLFDHQKAHCVTEHTGDNDRIIIRFDVTYQAIGKL